MAKVANPPEISESKRIVVTDEAICGLAREIWEREGRPEGKSLEHWVRAEAELSRKAKLQVRTDWMD